VLATALHFQTTLLSCACEYTALCYATALFTELRPAPTALLCVYCAAHIATTLAFCSVAQDSFCAVYGFCIAECCAVLHVCYMCHMCYFTRYSLCTCAVIPAVRTLTGCSMCTDVLCCCVLLCALCAVVLVVCCCVLLYTVVCCCVLLCVVLPLPPPPVS
jgi:hypothetical protein